MEGWIANKLLDTLDGIMVKYLKLLFYWLHLRIHLVALDGDSSALELWTRWEDINLLQEGVFVLEGCLYLVVHLGEDVSVFYRVQHEATHNR